MKEMNPLIRRILAMIIGLIVGSVVNMLIIKLFIMQIPAPEGVDINSVDSIKANIGKYEFKHFVGPFLGHAIGSLIGAFAAAKFCKPAAKFVGLFVGTFFLLGGAMMIYKIGGPVWFILLDIIVAYIPMAFLGYKLAGKK